MENIRVAMAKTAGNEGTVEEATKILEAGGIEVPHFTLQRLCTIDHEKGIESRDAANFTGLVLGCIETKFCK